MLQAGRAGLRQVGNSPHSLPNPIPFKGPAPHPAALPQPHSRLPAPSLGWAWKPSAAVPPHPFLLATLPTSLWGPVLSPQLWPQK